MTDAPVTPSRRRGRPPKERRRAKGEGTVYKVKDGLYRAQVTIGYEPDPKRPGKKRPVRKSIYAGDEATAIAERNKALAQLARPGGRDRAVRQRGARKELLETYLLRWRDQQRGIVAVRTWEKYSWAITCHLVPALGQLPIGDLTTEDVQRMVSERTDTIKASSLHIVRNTLAQALEPAVKAGTLDENPARGARLPKIQRPDQRPLTPEQAQLALAKAVEPNKYSPGFRNAALFTLALHCGCRPGELLALEEGDIDWTRGDAGAIFVRRNLSAVANGKASTRDPKTGAGRRWVFLTPDAADALRKRLADRAEEREAWRGRARGDYRQVFCSRQGTPLLESNVVRSWKALLKKAGLPTETRLYDTRHTTASILAADGTDPATIARQLGHTDAGFTARTYLHSYPEAQRDAVRRLASRLSAQRRVDNDEASE